MIDSLDAAPFTQPLQKMPAAERAGDLATFRRRW
jgi:hypothetical protein